MILHQLLFETTETSNDDWERDVKAYFGNGEERKESETKCFLTIWVQEIHEEKLWKCK